MDEGFFTLDTDASNESIGAVLSQQQNREEKVSAFASKSLDKTERHYCVTCKELFAVVYFLHHFKQYLLGRKFRVRTEHAALTWLRKTPEPIDQQARWLKQMEVDFVVEHRPRKRHKNVDALSRCLHPKKDCLCEEPSPAFFSGPAIGPQVSLMRVMRVMEVKQPKAASQSPVSCRAVDCDQSVENVTELKAQQPILSGPANRRHCRRYQGPRLSTVMKEEE